jgi:hypothetical protein
MAAVVHTSSHDLLRRLPKRNDIDNILTVEDNFVKTNIVFEEAN